MPDSAAVRRLLPLLVVAALSLATVPAAYPAPQGAATAPARTAATSGPARPAALQAALRSAAERAKLVALGIHVRDVASGEDVFARSAHDPFILASNTKILTTAAALEVLGPGYLFETGLLARGPVEDGTLAGDLAVVGGGDPLFSWRLPEGDSFWAFRQWAAALRERGIRRVTGDLYLDHGLFGPPEHNPGWNPDNYLKWYQAPVEAFAFDENTVKVSAIPAPRAGQPARVVTVPDLPFFDLQGQVRTVPSWSGNLLRVGRSTGSNVLRVSGGVYVRADKLEFPLSVADPVGYFGAAVRHALAAEGVEVMGELRPVDVLPGLRWEQIAVHRSPLLEVVEITNRESQNLFAEMLVKLVGARRCGAGTWENGTRAVEDFLVELGVERGTFSVADGSGLARGNRLSPAQMTWILAKFLRRPWGQAFLQSLPTGAQEGSSLEKRLEDYAGRVHAKTGTIAGVSTLSGYVRGASGRLYAFSVLGRGGVGGARDVQDAVVMALGDHG
ncbi:MAG TPA: D-alanyl-D-alanine carboxypeptidase/D-alanyl-D-alanine-endopeptidase [Thermoanaerobaculia bacterium]|nr:D-alanyl-D-alanine carboxypeptidase/D-alanyl-D-alanine-endopeptidase [Thermoanaerobaculia bacterium]